MASGTLWTTRAGVDPFPVLLEADLREVASRGRLRAACAVETRVAAYCTNAGLLAGRR